MNVKSYLWLISVVLIYLSTFLLSFFEVSSDYYGYGIGALANLPKMFQDPEYFVGGEITRIDVVMSAYALLFFFVSLLILLGGFKFSTLKFIGSLLPIILGFYIIFLEIVEPSDPNLYIFEFFLIDNPIETNGTTILLIHLEIGDLGLGTYLLFIGGICGIISSFWPSDKDKI